MTFLYIFIIYQFGIVKGIITIWLFYKIYDHIMLKIFKLERATTGDKLFLWGTHEETFNLMSVMLFENLNIEDMTNLIIERGFKKFRKLRSTLVYKYFSWWWKEVPLEESIKRIQVITDPNITTFKNKEEIVDFAYKELAIRFNLEKELPFKIMFIKNEKNEKSLQNILIIKFDHSFSDGIGFNGLVCALADNYSTNLFPAVMSKSLSFSQKILFYLLLPYNMLRLIYYVGFDYIREDSPFKTNKVVSGTPKFAMSDLINLQEHLSINKKLGITFNDLIITTLSSAYHKFCINHHKHRTPKNIIIGVPVNLYPLPKTMEDIRISNNTAGSGARIQMVKDPIKECKTISKKFGLAARDVFYVMTNKMLYDFLLTYFPFYLTKAIFLHVNKSFDFFFSNLPGPRDHLVYNGNKLEEFLGAFTPGFSHAFVGLMSYSGIFRIMVVLDSCLEIEPGQFLDYIVEELRLIKAEVISEKKLD